MAKKQVIRLTEGDLRKIIKESVNKVLRENDNKRHEMDADWKDYDGYSRMLKQDFERDKSRVLKRYPWDDREPTTVFDINVSNDEDPLKYSSAMGLYNNNVHDRKGKWSMAAQMTTPNGHPYPEANRARKFNGTIDSLSGPKEIPFSKKGFGKTND